MEKCYRSSIKHSIIYSVQRECGVKAQNIFAYLVMVGASILGGKSLTWPDSGGGQPGVLLCDPG